MAPAIPVLCAFSQFPLLRPSEQREKGWCSEYVLLGRNVLPSTSLCQPCPHSCSNCCTVVAKVGSAVCHPAAIHYNVWKLKKNTAELACCCTGNSAAVNTSLAYPNLRSSVFAHNNNVKCGSPTACMKLRGKMSPSDSSSHFKSEDNPLPTPFVLC